MLKLEIRIPAADDAGVRRAEPQDVGPAGADDLEAVDDLAGEDHQRVRANAVLAVADGGDDLAVDQVVSVVEIRAGVVVRIDPTAGVLKPGLPAEARIVAAPLGRPS